MSIKILVIGDFNVVLPSRPAAETFIALHKMGLCVEIMTNADSEYAIKFKKAGISVIDFQVKKKLNRKEIAKIREELVNGKHDILHLLNSPAIINGIQAAFKLAVKVVLYRGYTGHIKWYDPIAYIKYLNPRVDKIICNSEGVKTSIRKHLIFKKNKATTIYKGHCSSWYDGVISAGLREFGIPKGAFTVICVANVRKMKGISYLLKSMNLLSDLPVHCLLVGEGMSKLHFHKEVQNNLSKDRIHFAGYRTDVLQLSKASSVFVMASIKGEGMNRALIEAMSLGIVPIVTDIPGHDELIIDHENGLLVPICNVDSIAECIKRLYHNNELCHTLGQNAKERIFSFINLEKTVLETKDLYEEVLDIKYKTG